MNTPECNHASFQTCDRCRQAPIPKGGDMSATVQGTTNLLMQMVHEKHEIHRVLSETIGRLKAENEALKVQIAELKRKRRSKARVK